jgi:hypothetical protein
MGRRCDRRHQRVRGMPLIFSPPVSKPTYYNEYRAQLQLSDLNLFIRSSKSRRFILAQGQATPGKPQPHNLRGSEGVAHGQQPPVKPSTYLYITLIVFQPPTIIPHTTQQLRTLVRTLCLTRSDWGTSQRGPPVDGMAAAPRDCQRG